MAIELNRLEEGPLRERENQQNAPGLLWDGRQVVNVKGFSRYRYCCLGIQIFSEFNQTYHNYSGLRKIIPLINLWWLELKHLWLPEARDNLFNMAILTVFLVPVCVITCLLLQSQRGRDVLSSYTAWAELNLSRIFLTNCTITTVVLRALGVEKKLDGHHPILFQLSESKAELLKLFQRLYIDTIRIWEGMERRDELDPEINPAHLNITLPGRELSEPPTEINLDDLSHFDPDIDLSEFVAHVKNGCQGLGGAHSPGTPEAKCFATRLAMLTRNIIYQLKNGEHDTETKKAVCEGLKDASIACAPRHMEEAEMCYYYLTANEILLTTEQKVLQIAQKLRVEIMDRLTQSFPSSPGSPHVRNGLLKILGPTFNIPGHDAQKDPFSWQFEEAGEEIKKKFRGLYTANEMINRFDSAVNVPAKLQKVKVQELAEWIRATIPIPETYDPSNEDREVKYHLEEVCKLDRQGALIGIQREALRRTLVHMNILRN